MEYHKVLKNERQMDFCTRVKNQYIHHHQVSIFHTLIPMHHMVRVYVPLHPYISQQIQNRQAWSQPQQKKEPLMYDILVELSQYQSISSLAEPFLSLESLVYDTTWLGCFTGSRVSEYAQSGLARNQRFNTVPINPDTGSWGGQSLAFIRSDFTFYNCLIWNSNITIIKRTKFDR